MMNKVISSMLITLCAAGAAAQTTTDAAVDSTSKAAAPVAYVYVSRPTHLDGFAASSSGKLTPVPGSPYANVSLDHMSVTKKFLFGGRADNSHLYSFSIGSNGAIKPISDIDAQAYSGGCGGGLGPIALDATGTTLYTAVNFGCEEDIESFKIESNGDLGYLGDTGSGLPSDLSVLDQLRVEGANKFAYQVGWGGDEGFLDPYIVRYKRESNGLMSYDGRVTGLPKTKNPQDYYIPYGGTTDASNHVAMALAEVDTEEGYQVLPFKMASFTVESDGSLESKSTYENMATCNLTTVDSMSISPSGKFLAVAGAGFQLFHFDGSGAITQLTKPMLSGDVTLQFGWDNANHLYVLTYEGLHVYNLTSDSVKEASGSPYSIPEASSVIVLSE